MPTLNGGHENEDELDMFGGRVPLVSARKGASSHSSGSPIAMDAQSMSDSPQKYTPPLSQQRLNRRPSEGTSLHARLGQIVPQSAGVGPSQIQAQAMNLSRSTDSTGDADYEHPWSSESVQLKDYYGDRANARENMDWPTSSLTGLEHVRGGHAQAQHFVRADSHAPHAAIGGMSSMEFAHGVSASPHSEYVPNQAPHPHMQSHPLTHGHPHAHQATQYHPHGQSVRDVRYGQAYASPSHFEQAPGTFHAQQQQAQSYATAPRELAEMGLAPQHSGMDQRWTTFMQEGLYFNNSNPAM